MALWYRASHVVGLTLALATLSIGTDVSAFQSAVAVPERTCGALNSKGECTGDSSPDSSSGGSNAAQILRQLDHNICLIKAIATVTPCMAAGNSKSDCDDAAQAQKDACN